MARGGGVRLRGAAGVRGARRHGHARRDGLRRGRRHDRHRRAARGGPRGGGLPELPTGHGIYVVVEDMDTHHERAKAAGACIVYGPEDTDFGTRRYRIPDPEGYEWSFGTYSSSA